jgi:hypothetical protein
MKLRATAFAVGIAAGFLYCRHEGALAAERNPFDHFVRFYQALGPPSGFYASVNQLAAMAKSRASKSDVLVVVGGNSTFLGVAQPLDQLWSRKLEQSLGPGYVVVNFAQRGGPATGAAGSVAEALLKDGYRVIYVANMLPPEWGQPDGDKLYGYMFWNARARGLLYPYDAREQALAKDDTRRDLKIRAQLDRWSNAEDLWNTLCYQSFCTAYDSFTDRDFWRPRSYFHDLEGPAPPSPQRFQRDQARGLEILGKLVHERDTDQLWSDLSKQVNVGFVPEIRSRSLIVVTSYASYYVRQLGDEDRAHYQTMMRKSVELLRAGGVNSIAAGADYPDEDYADLVHLVPPGAERLAAEVAPEVRRIAHEIYGKD